MLDLESKFPQYYFCDVDFNFPCFFSTHTRFISSATTDTRPSDNASRLKSIDYQGSTFDETEEEYNEDGSHSAEIGEKDISINIDEDEEVTRDVETLQIKNDDNHQNEGTQASTAGDESYSDSKSDLV